VRTNHVLVDFENVQPEDLGLLREGPFKIKVFLGPTQGKVPVALAAAIQPLGQNAEYIVLESAGRNALDFHIAYYIGLLSAQEPLAFFHIISRDTGFDPLIKHLRGKKILAQRSIRVADIPYFKPALPGTEDTRINAVIANLASRKASKPRTRKTLLGTLHALFRQELDTQQLSALFDALCARGIVRLEGDRIHYDLPDPA